MNTPITYKQITIIAIALITLSLLWDGGKYIWTEFGNYQNLQSINKHYPIRCNADGWQDINTGISDNGKYGCVDKEGKHFYITNVSSAAIGYQDELRITTREIQIATSSPDKIKATLPSREKLNGDCALVDPPCYTDFGRKTIKYP